LTPWTRPRGLPGASRPRWPGPAPAASSPRWWPRTTAAYDAALRYAQERRQFGEPLASFQIIQQRLVSMLADLTAMQLYCVQIGRLGEAGRLTPTVAGLAKMHNTRKARAIAAEARDMLGGNGILLDYQVMRHMVDLEAIHTFEGTETMQTLIVGRAITGIGAFT
jgi:glutaryl-CoA dehydrogenase